MTTTAVAAVIIALAIGILIGAVPTFHAWQVDAERRDKRAAAERVRLYREMSAPRIGDVRQINAHARRGLVDQRPGGRW